MRRLATIAVVPLVALTACSPPVVSGTASPPPRAPSTVASSAPAAHVAIDETFRENAPVAAEAVPFVLPTPVAARLRNGIPVFVFPSSSIATSIAIVATGGLSDAGAEHGEVVHLMAHGMTLATIGRDRNAINATMAAHFIDNESIDVTADALSLQLTGKSSELDVIAGLGADFVLRPTYPPKNFIYSTDAYVVSTEKSEEDGRWLARLAFSKVAFGHHFYAGLLPSSRALRRVTRAEVEALSRRVLDPSRLAVVVAADGEPSDVVRVLEEHLGGAKTGSLEPRPAPLPPGVSGRRIVVVNLPGRSLATVLQGAVGPAAWAPDVEAAEIALGILASDGRIKQKLGTELGVVAGVTERCMLFRAGSEMAWNVQTANENVASVLRETDRLLRTYAQEGPSEAEFDDARKGALSSFASSFATARGTVAFYAHWLGQGVSPDEVTKLPGRWSALTVDEVRLAARTYLGPDRVQTIVVGDWAALRDSILALGWGPVEVRDPQLAIVQVEGGKRP
jgi:zinc protease